MNSVEKAFFEYCKKFKRLPSFSETYKDQPVGRWRWRISNLYHHKKLPETLVDKLAALPFGELSADAWYSFYEDFEYSLEKQFSLTPDLELWLEKQSDLFQRYRLPEEKIKLLDQLPISWLNINGTQRRLIHNWFQRFELLKDFYSQFKKLPTNKHRGRAEFGFDLYDWLNRQRKYYRINKLQKKQIDLLNEVEAGWYLNEVKKSFYSKLAFLKEYFNKHNSYPDSDGWLIENRMLYRQGKMPAWKVQELEKLTGWDWAPRQAKFRKNYDIVREFLRKHKRMPHIGETWQGINVSSWIISARSRYREGGSNFSKEKAALIEKLPFFSWDKQSDDWANNYKLLKEFLDKFKRYPIPKETYKKAVIGSWVGTQRARYKKHLILDEEEKLLKMLPDWTWSPLDDIWNGKYQNYFQESKSYLTEDSINWARKQRTRYKKGRLEQDRILLLEKLPNWTWAPSESKWHKYYSDLLTYIKAEGSFPSSKSFLGTWIYNQILNYKHGRLSHERVELLEKVPNWKWDADGTLMKSKSLK